MKAIFVRINQRELYIWKAVSAVSILDNKKKASIIVPPPKYNASAIWSNLSEWGVTEKFSTRNMHSVAFILFAVRSSFVLAEPL